ncbi:MAG TPA: tetratricopeptide repeat protein, partial [Pirellulales bacterium]
ADRKHSRRARPAKPAARTAWPAVWRSKWAFFACLLVLAIVVYWPALNSGFIWDDDDYVTANPALRSLAGLRDIWFRFGSTPQYYPVVFSTFWLEYQIWQDWAPGYHLVNVLLHAANAGLVYLVLSRLSIPGAWVAAMLFLVHPVQVESVAWITERKNTLSACLYLAAGWSYLQFLDDQPRQGRGGGLRWYAGAVLLYAAALLSKTVTCSLPAALLLLVWWRRGRVTRRDLIATLPLFALGIALAAVTVYLERHHVGAVGDDWSLTPLDRLLIAGRALWFYGCKLLWPTRLSFVYPRWQIDTAQWWQYLYPVAGATSLALLWGLRRRIGRGPLVAILFFGGTLLPALGFVNIYPMRYTFVADHYQYLASLGILTLVGVGIAWLMRRWSFRSPALSAAVPSLLVLLLAIASHAQTAIYHDQVALWTDTIAKSPRCWMAYNNLGTALVQDPSTLGPEQLARLDQLFGTALELNPRNPETQNSLASLRLIEGRVHAAARHAREALRLAPEFANARSNYGAALARQGNLTDARHELELAIRLNPALAEAHGNLANVLTTQGHFPEAVAQYQSALRINPDYYLARLNYALTLADHGQLEESLRQYGLLLARRPDSAEGHYQLGNLQLKFQRADLARERFQTAVRLDPRHGQAYNNLGALLLQEGDRAAAVECFTRAVAADPGNVSARNNLHAARRALRP